MINSIVRDIMPAVNQKMPDVELHIAGAKPTYNILSLKSKNVQLHIDVPNMVPYLHQAGVFLHPHSGGSGIQNKLLEAMACGCPVVTTPTGNQGIYAKHEESVLIGSTKEELIRHTIKLLSDPQFAATISANARKLIEEKHSWEAVYDQVDSVISELID
jgi:glycosyltransferase involved in cell wall biosynthesis